MNSRSRRWRNRFTIAFMLIGLLIVTAWNLTSSNALVAARASYSRGDLGLCLQEALSHLRRQPWSGEAALYAARSLSRLDYAEAAEPYFRRAGKLSQNDQQIRAYGLARGPHPLDAIPLYHEILARAPDNVTALRRLAALELAHNDTAELLNLADRLGRIPRGAVIGQTLLGIVHHNDNNPQRAVECFERVLNQDPDLREMPLSRRLFWTHLSDDLISSGRVDEAGVMLTKSLESTSDPELMNRLGQIRVLQGQMDDAERCFRQAMEWEPGNFQPYVGLSRIALQRQQPQEALRYLNQANQLAPRDYSVLYSLAAVYRLLGRPTEAARVQETLAQLRDKSAVGAAGANQTWPSYAL